MMGNPYEKLLEARSLAGRRPCFWRVFRKWSSAYLKPAQISQS